MLKYSPRRRDGLALLLPLPSHRDGCLVGGGGRCIGVTACLVHYAACVSEALGDCRFQYTPGLLATFSWWFAHPYLAMGGVQLLLPVLQWS